VEIVKRAKKKGTQGVIITEHHYLWTDEELASLRRASEVEKSFIILSGQEIKTDIGHVLVYGGDKTIDKAVSLEELRRIFPDAALVWAHPFRDGKVPGEKELCSSLLDAVEIFNINHTPQENYLGLTLWHKYKFTAVAGTDAHQAKDVGLFTTQVLHPVQDMKGFVEEVKRGRCVPFLKEIPKSGSNLVITEITMGTKGGDEVRNRLITKKFSEEKKWQTAKRSLGIREEIYDKGFSSGKYRVPKTLDINEKDRLIIEEGQRGDMLFDTLLYVAPEVGNEYFKLSAEWLAKMHGLGLRDGEKSKTLKREEKRFVSYLKSFESTNNPHCPKVRKFIGLLQKETGKVFADDNVGFVLSHGDYHPKNIIIGQDRARDIGTLYVSVIDFDSAIAMPPEFDIGYFISQFLYQFHDDAHVLKRYGEKMFLKAYRAISDGKINARLVALFRLRANMSIASFLIKVGKGESPDMEILMKDSGKLFSRLSGK